MNTSSTVAWYSSRIRGGAKLSLDRELHLARAAGEGSREALDELIENKLAFVIKVAGEYRHTGVPFEDLLAEGNIGLMEAVRHFDPGKGNRFVTYAIWWIRKAILTALRRHGRLVNVSGYQQRRIREIRDAERRLEAGLGRAPSEEEILAEVPGRRSAIEPLLRFRHVEMSLDEPVPGTDDLRFADSLADPGTRLADEEIVFREECALLRQAIGELTGQEQQVIALRFGLQGDPPMTLAEVGERIGLSRERVRQIECQGKDRLRRWFLRQRWNGTNH
jgi:RNA polymerase primary sigma factor